MIGKACGIVYNNPMMHESDAEDGKTGPKEKNHKDGV